MIRIPWKIQIALVACGYAMALGIAGILIAWRYWQYVTHPVTQPRLAGCGLAAT